MSCDDVWRQRLHLMKINLKDFKYSLMFGRCDHSPYDNKLEVNRRISSGLSLYYYLYLSFMYPICASKNETL
jgi:hypothetical protein